MTPKCGRNHDILLFFDETDCHSKAFDSFFASKFHKSTLPSFLPTSIQGSDWCAEIASASCKLASNSSSVHVHAYRHVFAILAYGKLSQKSPSGLDDLKLLPNKAVDSSWRSPLWNQPESDIWNQYKDVKV